MPQLKEESSSWLRGASVPEASPPSHTPSGGQPGRKRAISTMKEDVDTELEAGLLKRGHPYLSGNFAPVHRTYQLTPCTYSGSIPKELAGGEYVRNGGNPVTNETMGRDAHWFDGDGMLSGVLFRRTEKDDIQPEFANQYILTDVYLSSINSPRLRTPILPSIATLVNPMTSLLTLMYTLIRTLILVILSRLPGSRQTIEKISVANTALVYHDGRALATCESGPPMRISLPGLETVDWFNGQSCRDAEGPIDQSHPGFGGSGIFSAMREWTAAHPRTDPKTKELLLFHSTFVPPYINYSIVKSTYNPSTGKELSTSENRLFNKSIPGVSSARMMHDFGVSSTHTVIMDLPLSLDPFNSLKNKPVVGYDPTARSRFGIFPRYHPEEIRWFETNACCVFHTANTWNTSIPTRPGRLQTETLNMLVARLTSASILFSAGDIAAPQPLCDVPRNEKEEEQSRLYYYEFDLTPNPHVNKVLHQFGLSVIPFEFPSLRDSVAMSKAKYIYGCSAAGVKSFGAALGRAVKIDTLVKMDVERLIEQGKENPPTPITGCVDVRSIEEILLTNDPDDAIKLFRMPRGWYAQETRFVPRNNGASEDDGWILSYVFDESQLDEDGECVPDAKSELWVIDARNMTDIVARIALPQRVPYGMHGNWFSEQDIQDQRPVERLRSIPTPLKPRYPPSSFASVTWMAVREAIEGLLE